MPVAVEEESNQIDIQKEYWMLYVGSLGEPVIKMYNF